MQLDCKEQQLTEACSQRDEITDKYNNVAQQVSVSIHYALVIHLAVLFIRRNTFYFTDISRF